MKTPSLDEMKLAVAKMLPDEIKIEYGRYFGGGNRISWVKRPDADVSSREWLHVCWLAEQSLRDTNMDEFAAYAFELQRLKPTREWWRSDAATRLEALCRVRCPEMFE